MKLFTNAKDIQLPYEVYLASFNTFFNDISKI